MNKLYLEQLKLGELDPEREVLLKSGTGWEKELAELEKSDADILARYPAGLMAEKINRRRENSVKTGRIVAFPKTGRVLLPLLSVAAALLLFALSLPYIISRFNAAPGTDPFTETTRIKGVGRPDIPSDPMIHVYRNAKDSAEELADKAPASAGDRLQISYYAPARVFGAIFSLDGNETLTMHLPEKGSEMVALEHGREIFLPWAYELDNAPRYETFLLVYARKPVSISVLSEVIRSVKNPAEIEERLVSLYGKNAGIGVYSVQITKR